MVSPSIEADFRRTVRVVAILNLAYFGLEFAVAETIGSVSLFADSVDFLEDASVNFLILVALGWSMARRATVGMGLAALLLVPAVAALWTAYAKFGAPTVPTAGPLALTGAGALVVNVYCAMLLARFRKAEGSLSRAAYLSARNDAFANIGIIAVGGLTAWFVSPWPDVVLGIAIAAMNADAAWEVWTAARKEREARS
jgi:Co/Zn/Cd efflux system component